MKTELIHERVWPHLTVAARSCQRPADVAVAYFGKGASKLLRLPSGSRLVVDASEHAVSSGQTCPLDLLKMLESGTNVYSIANLHAKVYVLGKKAFIGSANVSRNSSENLVEAVLCTTDPRAVAKAREFVRGLCLQSMTPEYLKRLEKLYRPPKFSGGKRRKKTKETSARLVLPRLSLAQLIREDWDEAEHQVHDAGMEVAKKKREHRRKWYVDSYHWQGRHSPKRGDVVVQVVNEGGGRVLADPPANVIHVRQYRRGKHQKYFVYVELPSDKRRRSIKSLSKQLGRGTQKLFRRNGFVQNKNFAEALLALWEK